MARTSMPLREPFVVPSDPNDPAAKRLPKMVMNYRWVQFWGSFFSDVDTAPRQKAAVTLDVQNGAIPTTPFNLPSIAAGVYAIGYYMAVVVPAGVSSSMTITFRWTHDGVPKSRTFAAMNGNLVTTNQEDEFPIRVDKDAALSYEVAYASVPASAAQFSLDAYVEEKRIDGQ